MVLFFFFFHTGCLLTVLLPCPCLDDHYRCTWDNTGSPVAEAVASNCSKTDTATSCHEKGCPHTSPLACCHHLPSARRGLVNRFREMDSNKPTLPKEAVLRVVSSWPSQSLNSSKHKQLLKAIWVSFHMWARKERGCGTAVGTKRPKMPGIVSTILKTLYSLIPWRKSLGASLKKKYTKQTKTVG